MVAQVQSRYLVDSLATNIHQLVENNQVFEYWVMCHSNIPRSNNHLFDKGDCCISKKADSRPPEPKTSTVDEPIAILHALCNLSNIQNLEKLSSIKILKMAVKEVCIEEIKPKNPYSKLWTVTEFFHTNLLNLYPLSFANDLVRNNECQSLPLYGLRRHSIIVHHHRSNEVQPDLWSQPAERIDFLFIFRGEGRFNFPSQSNKWLEKRSRNRYASTRTSS